MTNHVEPDWAAVRHAYERTNQAVSEIAAEHGMSVDRLHYQRRKENWAMRSPGTGRARRHNVLGRIMLLVEAQVSALETKLEEDGQMSATDMRLLESMTKTLDKLIALQNAHKKAAPKRVRMSPELEAVRQRLIERVQELGE